MSLSCEPGVYDDAVLIDQAAADNGGILLQLEPLGASHNQCSRAASSLRQNDHIVDIHRHPAERLPIVMSFYLPGVATTVCAG